MSKKTPYALHFICLFFECLNSKWQLEMVIKRSYNIIYSYNKLIFLSLSLLGEVLKWELCSKEKSPQCELNKSGISYLEYSTVFQRLGLFVLCLSFMLCEWYSFSFFYLKRKKIQCTKQKKGAVEMKLS